MNAPNHLPNHSPDKPLDILLDTQLIFSVQYPYTSVPAKGFLARFKPQELPLDVDLACAIYDHHKQLIELVWYGNVRDKTGAVRHDGDALVGAKTSQQAGLHQEAISIRLDKLPRMATHLALFAHVHGNHALNHADGRIFLGDKLMADDEILLTDLGDAHALYGWQINKIGDAFYAERVCLPITGDSPAACLDDVARYLTKDDLKIHPKMTKKSWWSRLLA